jgi:hypothetical protein
MSEKKNDRVDLTVNEMSQHVYQHAAEPRDFDYRVQAFAFALSITPDSATSPVIDRAVEIEKYLRIGTR